jgi:hypothetical protein
MAQQHGGCYSLHVVVSKLHHQRTQHQRRALYGGRQHQRPPAGLWLLLRHSRQPQQRQQGAKESRGILLLQLAIISRQC